MAEPVDAGPEYRARLAASLENWKRKLLDLSRRNRALNFKPTKVSTVAIVDEVAAEVFRKLYLQETSLRFRPTAEASVTARSRVNAPAREPESPVAFTVRMESSGVEVGSDDPAEIDEDTDAGLEFVPYDPASVDERHTDDWLQTSLAADQLDHSLRRIEELSRVTLEEQGVNTLFLALGMLKYRESADSDSWFRAPLVLLPVTLTRTSARAGFILKAGDEDALVNPALVEILRGNFGLALPTLPDSEAIPDAYDLQEFFKGVIGAVANQPGWTVQSDIYLSLFAFQKLAMFKDLERNAESIGSHRLVRQLLTRGGGTAVYGLPAEVRDLPLDLAFCPEETFQVVDADSSQMRAAAAVARELDLVIEGPPGTGKSQTITNLVAQALAAGKSVLFVAEKMAALEVVHRRLLSTGLGEFCLELHSSKANKRVVMQGLSAALDASLQSVTSSVAAGARLPAVRTALAEYVHAVHAPFGALAESPYTVFGRLGSLLAAPRVSLSLNPAEVSAASLTEAQRSLHDLAVHAAAVGNPASHPWRGAARTLYTEADLDRVQDAASTVEQQAKGLATDSADVASRFGAPAPMTIGDVAAMRELADLLADSPGVGADVLMDDGWNAVPAGATELVEAVEVYQRLNAELAGRFTDAALDPVHADDVAYVEQKSSGLLSFLSFFDGRFRSIKRRWLSYRKPGYAPSVIDQATDLKAVGRWQQQASQLEARAEQGRTLFGSHWKGSASEPARLRAYADYVVKFRRMAAGRGLTSVAAAIAQQRAADVSPIRAVVDAAKALEGSLASLRAAGDWPADFLGNSALTEIATRAGAIGAAVDSGPAWAALEGSRQRAAATAAAEVAEAAMQGGLDFGQAGAAFARALYMGWLAAAVQGRPALRAFDGLTHQATVDEFRALDQRVLKDNRATLIGRLRERAQARLQEPEAAGQLTQLRREMAKQRRIAPLRRTLRECGHAVRAIKPCWMMSPLTVAQYLDGDGPAFDLVIFDEASQLPTEDAVGTIVRGRQLVVVGDPKQLPPTNFFSVSSGAVAAPLGDDGAPLYEDSESVLEEFMGAAVPMSRLKWHYRSAHESLINFSNVNFYDADLHTFPSVESGTDRAGLQFQFVPDGVYEGRGVNLVEARRVADEVVAFAKLQLQAKATGASARSLGVGTLNLRQQMAIIDELEIRRRNDPSIEPFFDRLLEEPFFVKNLENIQGDERDAIYLSITYGRGVDGRIRYNFGPLNRDNGWRRLNVLVTRARRQMRVFASMRDHDINPVGSTSDGPRLLREFLAYAEHGRLEGVRTGVLDDAESPFEREVCQELINRGVTVQPQVGVCGYRVDIGVLDPDVPGRFICGIECDGMAYHSMETVRDRDRLRQQVLEDRGWIIHRVWSTDWFKDRKGQIERLVKAIAQSKEQAAAAARQELEERETAEPVSVAAPPVTAAARESSVAPAVVAQYEAHEFDRILAGEILDAPTTKLADMIAAVVEREAPVHETDVIARICDAWGTSAGSRIKATIQVAGAAAARQGRFQKRGPFYWRVDGRCVPRSRAGTGIGGDRIAPEEYVEAIKIVLASERALPRQAVISETRGLLGFHRTGPILENAIGTVIDALLLQGTIGEASTGLKLRGPAGGTA